MHAWELQKGLFISVLKIDLLLRRDVESFRVVSCSAAAAAAVVGAHVGGGGSADNVLPFHPGVKAAVSTQLPASFCGDLRSPILPCFDY